MTEEYSSIHSNRFIEGVASRLRGGVDVSEDGVWAFAVAQRCHRRVCWLDAPENNLKFQISFIKYINCCTVEWELGQ